MSKTHTFTRIMLAGIGIFFVLRIIPQMLTGLWIIATGRAVESSGMVFTWMALLIVSAVVLLYVFLYKGEMFAGKIAGTDDFAEAEVGIPWLPAGFRLICLTAGLYCLYTAVIRASRHLYIYLYYYGEHRPVPPRALIRGDEILASAVILAAGIYLICGAPHFVRWQLKKTLKQCKQFAEKETTTRS